MVHTLFLFKEKPSLLSVKKNHTHKELSVTVLLLDVHSLSASETLGEEAKAIDALPVVSNLN